MRDQVACRVACRALVYGALAAFITGVYAAIVVGVGAAVGAGGEPNLALSLLATAALAVAFQPFRARAQRLANRLIYGDRASPYEVLSAFSRRMAGALSSEEILPRTAEAVALGMGAARAQVRILLPGGGAHAEQWPPRPAAAAGAAPAGPQGAGAGAAPDEPSPPDVFDRVVPVLHGGEVVGAIALAKPPGEAMTPAEDKLLSDLASQAGIALSNARLTVELRARLAEIAAQAEALRASRERVVAVQDATRRRLERDIHDGAQQHLVALVVQLRLARQLVERDSARAGALLDAVAAQAAEALETLRALARGIFPAVLADRGLAPALRALVARAYPDVHLLVAPDLETARFDPQVEAALYFCCLEALQNAAKHAPGARAAFRLACEDGWLVFSVRDGGPGFDAARASRGTGLQSMADRMAALGGTLVVDAAPGRGTTIAGRVPLGPPPAAQDAWRPAVAAAQAATSVAGPNSAFGR